MSDDSQYIPALRFRFLTPLYDPVLRWGMREMTFKRRLITEARVAPGFRVLDLGCGTGTLTLFLKQTHPDTDVVGIDGDNDVLTIARAKAKQQGLTIPFDQGMAFQLPYPDRSFDRVLSSLVLHHLTAEDRKRTLREALRVLRPGGEFLIIDFGQPQNGLAWAISRVMRRFERTADLIQGVLVAELRRTDFQNVETVARFMTIFGTVALYRAKAMARSG